MKLIKFFRDIHALTLRAKINLLMIVLLLAGIPVLIAQSSQMFFEATAAGDPIALVGKSSTSGYTNTLSLPKPAGVTAGDVLVSQVVVYNHTTTITPPAGWTLIRRENSTATVPFSSALYYHVAGGSEPVSYTWNLSSATYVGSGIAAYRNVDTASPIDAHSGQVNTNTTSMTAPSVTTTTAQDQLLFFGSSGFNTLTSGPAGMTSQWNVAYAGYYSRSTLFDQLLTASGATGNRVATVTYSQYPNVGQLVALKPASVGPTATPTMAPTNTPTPTPTGGVTPTPTPTPTGGPTPTPVPGSQIPFICPQCNITNLADPGNRFAGKDFTDAFVPDITLSGATLAGSTFTNGIFRGAQLVNTNMTNANFTNANFTNANLNGATTTGATFTGATWSNTTCPDGTNSNANGGTCVGHL